MHSQITLEGIAVTKSTNQSLWSMLTFGRTEEITTYPKLNKSSNWNCLKKIDPENSYVAFDAQAKTNACAYREKEIIYELCVNSLFNHTEMRAMLHVKI